GQQTKWANGNYQTPWQTDISGPRSNYGQYRSSTHQPLTTGCRTPGLGGYRQYIQSSQTTVSSVWQRRRLKPDFAPTTSVGDTTASHLQSRTGFQVVAA
ncbi:unnamed protein product, partial [Didymodactylos carnosus]